MTEQEEKIKKEKCIDYYICGCYKKKFDVSTTDPLFDDLLKSFIAGVEDSLEHETY